MSDQDIGSFFGTLWDDIREQTQPVLDAARDIKDNVGDFKEDVAAVQATLADAGSELNDLKKDMTQSDNSSQTQTSKDV